jgi:hypothetical protein
MKYEKLELARGTGNVFRDLGRENADVEQMKGAPGDGNHQGIGSRGVDRSRRSRPKRIRRRRLFAHTQC